MSPTVRQTYYLFIERDKLNKKGCEVIHASLLRFIPWWDDKFEEERAKIIKGG